MSTDLSAKVTLGNLKHYHDKIFTDVITPINTILWDNATNSDIGALFSESPYVEPNTVKFVGIDSSTASVRIEDSSGNAISYDGSGEITLEEGKTYSIRIDPVDEDVLNKFYAEFTTDGQRGLIITPFFMDNLSSSSDVGQTDTKGVSVSGYMSKGSTGYWTLFNKKDNDNGVNFSANDYITISTNNKIKINRIGYDGNLPITRVDMYGSDDGENWTLIAGVNDQTYTTKSRSNSTSTAIWNLWSNNGRANFGTLHFFDMNNLDTGYKYHKFVFVSGCYRIFNFYIVEAYWVE